MVRTLLLPITTHDVNDAIGAAEVIAGHAISLDATVLVLETDCLHGWLTSAEPGYEDFERRRIHSAADRVADALRAHGARVEVALECVRGPQRPVDPETVRRHGAEIVFLPHVHRRGAVIETMRLRRLRREGITVLEPTASSRPAASVGRVATWDD